MKDRGWIPFVGKRWFAARSSAGGSTDSRLAASGIAAGVAALIVVLGVMNGFQQGYIDAILEISSFDARFDAEVPVGTSVIFPSGTVTGLADRIEAMSGVRSVLPLLESQVILRGRGGVARPILLRAIPVDVERRDPGLTRSLGVGKRFPDPGGGLTLGAEAARWLGITIGEEVEILAVAASESEGLEPRAVKIRVGGVFRSGYYDFDSGMAYMPMEAAMPLLPPDGVLRVVFGIKLVDRYEDGRFAAGFGKLLAGLRTDGLIEAGSLETWKSYNRSFFGALRTEKTAMMLLVGLIFLVVGVNIYHAMRRTVAERSEDLAVLRALGGSARDLRRTFILDGLAVGAGGALAGLALGLLVVVNVNEVFSLVEFIVNGPGVLVSRIAGGTGGDFRVFSPRDFYLVEVPVRVFFPETLFIVAAAASSGALAAGAAAGRVLTLDPAEALHYE